MVLVYAPKFTVSVFACKSHIYLFEQCESLGTKKTTKNNKIPYDGTILLLTNDSGGTDMHFFWRQHKNLHNIPFGFRKFSLLIA